MAEANDAARIEKMVSEMMRGARDEKIRLETLVQEQERQIAELHSKASRLSGERDDYQQRAAELATKISAISHIITSSRPNEPGQLRGLESRLSDLAGQNVATSRRPYVLDGSMERQKPVDLDKE